MFIPKREYKELIERISKLEEKVIALENKTEANTFEFGDITLKELCIKLPAWVDNRIVMKFASLSDEIAQKTKERMEQLFNSES